MYEPKGNPMITSERHLFLAFSSHTTDWNTYGTWYDEVHIPEILGLAPFRSARRAAAVDGRSFLTIYEVDDVDAAKAAMGAAQAEGRMTRPSGVQLDPPPTVQWFEDLGS